MEILPLSHKCSVSASLHKEFLSPLQQEKRILHDRSVVCAPSEHQDFSCCLFHRFLFGEYVQTMLQKLKETWLGCGLYGA